MTEVFYGINNFSLVVLYKTSEKLLGFCSKDSHRLSFRGGVEDTRLEAKAKDTKKIRGQGQGQPFRGQTLSRPRTGMLEAKAKDQGHKAKCSQKKRSSQKFFKRSPQKNVFQKIFQALHKILTIQKIGLEALRILTNRPIFEDWASRPRPRTSKSVLEAKDVLEDSTSAILTTRATLCVTTEIKTAQA